MPVQTALVKGDEWPSILDGDECDRGFEHFLRFQFFWTLAIADDIEVRLVVPPRETWAVEYINWEWTATPGWGSAEILRQVTGQYKNFDAGTPWVPIEGPASRKRTLYTIPGADEDVGLVNRSQLVTDLSGLRAGARWGFDWIGAIAAGGSSLFVEMLVTRIPVARERNWDREGVGKALTAVEQLARRVS